MTPDEDESQPLKARDSAQKTLKETEPAPGGFPQGFCCPPCRKTYRAKPPL